MVLRSWSAATLAGNEHELLLPTGQYIEERGQSSCVKINEILTYVQANFIRAKARRESVRQVSIPRGNSI